MCNLPWQRLTISVSLSWRYFCKARVVPGGSHLMWMSVTSGRLSVTIGDRRAVPRPAPSLLRIVFSATSSGAEWDALPNRPNEPEQLARHRSRGDDRAFAASRQPAIGFVQA